MKKIVSLCMGASLLASMSFASEIGIFFNGEKLVSDVPPVEINDRVMVPIRVISEKAGATVDFNYDTNEVTLTNNHAIVKLKINSNIGYINNQQKVLDVPATEINSRTLVPVRFVGEALGLDIQWDNDTYSVKIYGSNNTVSKENTNVKNNNDLDGFKVVGRLLDQTYYPKDTTNPFSEGLMCVEKDNKYGFVDKTGKEVIPCIYEEADNFSDGLALVRRVGEYNYGYIDKTGKVVIPCNYVYAESFSEGLAAVGNSKGEYGYIDKLGNLVVPYTYDSASNYEEGTALVTTRTNSKVNWLIIDKKGNEIDRNVIRDTFWFKNTMVADMKNGMCGYINLLNEEIVPYRYLDVETSFNGIGWVLKESGVGAVDITGKEVVPCIYSDFKGFSEGLAVVVKNYKCGYVDMAGKEVIPCVYNIAGEFSEGLARVAKDYMGYIDKTGKEVVPCKYRRVSNFHEGLAIMVEEDNTINIVEKE